MIKIIDIKEGILLADYEKYTPLALAVRELYTEAFTLVPRIAKRKIWMISSTESGGGVAEMMPRIISLLRQLGVEADWAVASTDKKEYFTVTKKIHNLIHGEGEASISSSEKSIYEEVNKQNAEEFLPYLKSDDIVVIHDPQPLPMCQFLSTKINAGFIWRCHIGVHDHSVQTGFIWNFLQTYIEPYDLSIFSTTEYIPGYLAGKATIIHPSIDPLDHKNRDLPLHKVVGILCNSNLTTEYHPVLTPPFTYPAKRLQPDGSFQSPLLPSDPGILFKPVILQISRWDRLKGFLPLLKGFEELKNNIGNYAEPSSRHNRRLELAELILAGPDPSFVGDDPEGLEVLEEISHYYTSLPGRIQNHITVLKLPMASRKENELIVNALQRIATVVVQNSLKEGFGLTVTEAMWKTKAVIGSSACGIKLQIRQDIDGKIIHKPEDPKEVALRLNEVLANPKEREILSYNAHKRVVENYLIFTQIRKWINAFAALKKKSMGQ